MKRKKDTGLVALVPMRHHSVRVSGKNFRKLGEQPLFHHILHTLESCPSVGQIAIDTDSDFIRDSVRKHFPKVRLIDRPEHLRADTVAMTDVLHHDATQIDADCFLQTHSTNPFLRAETIEAAIAVWREARQTHDSLFSVTRVQARLWDAAVRPINHNPWLLLRTQDLPAVYLENSNLYIFAGDLIRTSRRRIGDRPKMFEIDPLESLDIDDEQSFALAEQLLRVRSNSKP